ncbi:uncharacterized protein TM35_002681000, partial [Trypanosoma theileri]
NNNNNNNRGVGMTMYTTTASTFTMDPTNININTNTMDTFHTYKSMEFGGSRQKRSRYGDDIHFYNAFPNNNINNINNNNVASVEEREDWGIMGEGFTTLRADILTKPFSTPPPPSSLLSSPTTTILKRNNNNNNNTVGGITVLSTGKEERERGERLSTTSHSVHTSTIKPKVHISPQASNDTVRAYVAQHVRLRPLENQNINTVPLFRSSS